MRVLPLLGGEDSLRFHGTKFGDTFDIVVAMSFLSEHEDAAEPLLVELAIALHRYGMPAYRLEDSLVRAGSRYGVELHVFTVPTGLTLAFGPPAAQRVRLIRVQPGATNLTRIHELSELIEEIDGGLEPTAARIRLKEIERAPLPHGSLALCLGFALASATSAVLFGGSRTDVFTSFLVGLLVGFASIAAKNSDRVARLFEFGCASLAALIGGIVAAQTSDCSREIISLASIVVLLPGYAFTVALNELAARHLSSGTARLGGVFVTFLLLGCGSAFGFASAVKLCGAPFVMEPTALPRIATVYALCLAPLAFKILFQARHQDFPLILVAAWMAFLGAKAGAEILGVTFAAAGGALLLGLFSNAIARVRRRPSAITLVPGLLVLVPGSLGYRGFSSLLSDGAFGDGNDMAKMLAAGVSLVSGLLVANVILPSRKTL